MKLIPHKQTTVAKTWIKEEAAAQHQRYLQISQFINETMASARNKRYKAFLGRIQTRGYSVHYDQMRKITRAELPKEPRRKHRVVY